MNDSRKISYQSLKEKMSDEKLKRIIAGSGGGEDDFYGTCVWHGYKYGDLVTVYGLSLNAVNAYIDEFGVIYWYCDNCSSASWCDCCS